MPLFRAMPPLPDEWLAGLIARASATNGYDKSSDVLAFANLGQKRPEYFAFAGGEYAPHLAHLLGVPVEDILGHFHPRLDRQTVGFFGVPVRDLFIERRTRRVSPAGLRHLPYSRAIWQIRTFGFDPETLDPLVSECPECGTELSFKLTKGIEYCDRCCAETEYGFTMPTVDLRSIHQDRVQVDDRQALDFVTGLLNPAYRDFDTSLVPEAVGTRDRAQLFEIAHVIAAALVMNAENSINRTNWHRSEIGVIMPGYLAKAGRAILNFPDGFAELCEEASKDAEVRGGEWGVLKAFGALARIPRDRYVITGFRRQVSALLKQTLASRFRAIGVVGKGSLRPEKFAPLRALKDTVLDSQPALMRLAAHPKTRRLSAGTSPKAPVLLHRSQAQMTLIQYMDQVPAMTVALTLGIPADALLNLVHRRHMFIYTGMCTDIAAPDTYMSGRGLRSLVDRLIGDRKPQKPDPTYCTFAEAMLMFPAGRRPWVPLIERMLDGRVDHVLHKRPGKAVLKAMSVAGVEFIRDELQAEQAAMPRPAITTLTAGSVNLMLGISVYAVLQELVAAKELVLAGDGGFAYDDVVAFAEKYILANEVGARGRRPTALVRSWMDAHGIAPAYDFPTKSGLVYRRAEVDPFLELSAPSLLVVEQGSMVTQ